MDTDGRIAAAAPELAARLASFVARERLPGAAAGVVCGDDLAWLAGTGFADLATGQATDPAMRYGIASITKTFTGTAIMRLRDAGRLGLDDPAVAWLPELGALVSPFGPVETVTIRRMLSHESGLPAEPPGTDWSVPAYQGAPDQTLGQAGVRPAAASYRSSSWTSPGCGWTESLPEPWISFFRAMPSELGGE